MTASKMAAWVRRQGKKYKSCTAADVAAVLCPSEWHHTSKFYNATNYYNPLDLAELFLRRALAARLADHPARAAEKAERERERFLRRRERALMPQLSRFKNPEAMFRRATFHAHSGWLGTYYSLRRNG